MFSKHTSVNQYSCSAGACSHVNFGFADGTKFWFVVVVAPTMKWRDAIIARRVANSLRHC